MAMKFGGQSMQLMRLLATRGGMSVGQVRAIQMVGMELRQGSIFAGLGDDFFRSPGMVAFRASPEFAGLGAEAKSIISSPTGPVNPTVSTSPVPQLSPTAPPQRFHGPWSVRDIERARNGQGPLDFVPATNRAGREVPLELHHADQMPGSAIHEVQPFHSNIPGAHPNKFNQGVTPTMRAEDAQLHWYFRVKEMGY